MENLADSIRVAQTLFEAVDVNEAVKELEELLDPPQSEAKACRRHSDPFPSVDVIVPVLEEKPSKLFCDSMREAIPVIPKRKRKRVIVRRRKKRARFPSTSVSTDTTVSNPIEDSTTSSDSISTTQSSESTQDDTNSNLG